MAVTATDEFNTALEVQQSESAASLSSLEADLFHFSQISSLALT